MGLLDASDVKGVKKQLDFGLPHGKSVFVICILIEKLLQCSELNRGYPTFFVAPFSKYLVDGNKLFAVSPSFVIGPK